MSMDHPFYEELCRRKHPAARWWVVGDVLYYLGLIPACVAVSLVLGGLVAPLLGMGWQYAIVGAVLLPFCIVVFVVGAVVKNHAYVLAERDGIPASAGWPGTSELREPPQKGMVGDKPDESKGG